jgi:hypothetical protein
MNNHVWHRTPPALASSRRTFLNRFGLGLGGIALADLLVRPANLFAANGASRLAES